MGNPIVLLNDEQDGKRFIQRSGVARIDLPRLAQAKPGHQISFSKGIAWGCKMCGVSGRDSSVIDNELSATVHSGDCQRIKSAYLSKPIFSFLVVVLA
ncbi:hypothetical protein OK016_22745 [Vibrio chagasii]|nr:hypothetical protein [Vibrio chagasii]